MMTRLEQAKSRAREAVAEASEKALSVEEQEIAGLNAQAAEAKALALAADAARRADEGLAREDDARAAADGEYLVAYVDLVALFPPGNAPPLDKIPGGGVIVVRDAGPLEAMVVREVEHKNASNAKGLERVLVEVAIKSVIDPAPTDLAAGVKIRGFFERYTAAGMQVGTRARQLGGAKSAEAKRGRE